MTASTGGPRLKAHPCGALEAWFDDADTTPLFRGDGPASIAYGVFISSYLVWPLIAAALLAAIWSPAVKVAVLLCVLAYLPTLFDKSELKGKPAPGRPWHAFRLSSCWRLSWRYMRLRLVRSVELPPSAQYIFGLHPHGILLLSRIAFYAGVFEQLCPGVQCRVLAASPMFRVPLVRDICLALNAVDAGRATATRVMQAGLSAMLYPGGSRELLMTDASKPDQIFLKSRKGFCRLALESGAPLVPVYVFSEKRCYHRWLPPERVRLFFLRVLRIPLLVFWGRCCTWLPFRDERGLLVVMGAPIAVQKTSEPSAEAIDALHAQYEAALRALYLKWRAHAGYGEEELAVM